MGALYDPREELLVQLLVKGTPPTEAKQKAGFRPQASLKKILERPHVKARMQEMFERSAARAELTRADILEGIKADWHQARKLGQMSAALKAAEMLGKELYKMFVDRKEIGAPGDFDNKSEQELIDYIKQSYQELGMDKPETILLDNNNEIAAVGESIPADPKRIN